MMTIFLKIEKDIGLWQSTLIRLHMRGFKWHRTGLALDDFYHLNNILENDGKGLLINLEGKTVCWSRGRYNYCIEVKKIIIVFYKKLCYNYYSKKKRK